MRFIVIAFALLAGLKVWTQDTLYRSALGGALIDAYRERAQQVCTRETAKHQASNAVVWANGAEITVGSNLPRVMLWDYHNPLWDVRYRHPHIVLTSAEGRKLVCSFDLTAGVAFVEAI